ncbi:MAG: PAS domain-containing protein [Candidatus Cloacimonadota bacterium]|nr:MAG: PAS domain-containing protein [Candidatus Cloacimonadota bacterium]
MRKLKGFNPKYISWISIILAILMITTSFLVIKRIEASLLLILEKEGYALLESLITSSENSIKATDIAEQILEDRLLDNAKAIDQMKELNKEKLLTIANETHLKKIDVFDGKGNVLITSSLYSPEDISPPSALHFIFSEKSRIMSFKTEEGDFAVAIKRLNSSDVIVCYADAKYIYNFKQSIGIGNLIQKISKESGIEYILLQNEEGIVFATKNIEKMKKISNDTFLKNALLSNKKASREFDFEGRKVLEVVKPFSIAHTPYGVFRLGLSLEDYNSVLHDTKRHIVILSLFLFFIGFVIIGFIVTGQNYRLLNESFKQMEIFTKKVMDGINSAIVSIDKDLIITYLNKRTTSMFSLTGEGFLGKNYKLFFPQDELLLEKSISLKRNIDEVEKEYALPSGKRIYIGITTSLLSDEEERITGATALVRDLTLIKKLKEDLQEKERLKTIGVLASGVAHEIRNPLNALRLSIGKLKRDDERGTDKLLKIITDEIGRIEKTVEDFLSFTRPFNLRLSEVKLNHILDEIISLMDGEASDKGIVLKREFEVIPIVYGDETELRKVFMNIIRNSIDATDDGGEIVLKTVSDNKSVEVSIKDTGIGISEEDVTRIFDPYFTKKKAGTGLGMSIAKRIIEGHKGSISIESEIGKGTEITIRLSVG